MKTYEDLITHRDELRRQADACDDGARAYATQAESLRTEGALVRAELRGVEAGLAVLRAALHSRERLVPRFPLTVAADGED